MRSCSGKQEFRRSDIDFVNVSGMTTLDGSLNELKMQEYTYRYDMPNIDGAFIVDEDSEGAILVQSKTNGRKVFYEIQKVVTYVIETPDEDNLSDKTKVRNVAWKDLKDIAMQPGFENTASYGSLTAEEKVTLKKLKEA